MQLSTLGEFTIELDGDPLTGLASRKADALLVYLAVTRRPHSREHLATLLWDDRPLGRSLANLSVVLNSLKKQLEPFLQIERQTIAMKMGSNIIVDIQVMRGHLTGWMPKLEALSAIEINKVDEISNLLKGVRGGFLDGFHIRGARGFEEWVTVERERLKRELFQAHQALVRYFQTRGEFEAGLFHARRILEINPLQEEIHSALISMLVRSGRRAEALQHYKVLEEILDQELAVGPQPEVKALYERIRISDSVSRHNLPSADEPLFGRDSEMAAIRLKLQDPHCRLLTILGPGGIGKTSLARHYARRAIHEYINGVFFVSLAPVDAADYIPQSIINILALQLQGDEDPKNQLISYLREKELLLVLDNFEHLLGGADLLPELLRAAPDVKMVVTSRERLKLNEEWVFPLDGLDIPADLPASFVLSDGDPIHSGLHGAIDLFMHAARKVNPGYGLTSEDLQQIIRVCRLVEGMPLGIELGATWLRALPVKAIAEQIASDVDFLGAKEQDSPGRLQRMQVVFDRSWILLTAEEQVVFRKLSVFKGGFTLEAGERVAGSNLTILASLVDKSMLRFLDSGSRGRPGRYDLHELVRQYAHAKMRIDQDGLEAVNLAHCQYYCSLLQGLEADLRRTGQLEASQLVEDDIGNILVAWRWACAHHLHHEIGDAFEGLFSFFLSRGYFNQGEQEFGAAIDWLNRHHEGGLRQAEDVQAILARLKSRRAVFKAYLCQYEQAEADLLNNLEAQRRQEDQEETAFILKWLGTNARMATHYPQAIRHLEGAISLLKSQRNTVVLADALNELGAVALRQSRYEEANDYFLESIALRRELEDEQGEARILINLGLVAFRLGDYAIAKQRTTESLNVGRRIGDQWTIAASLNNLGYAEEHLGNYAVARELYEQSLEVKRMIGHRKGMAYSWLNLAMLAYRDGEYEQAIETNLQAEKVLQTIGDRWGLASAAQQLGRAYLAQGAIAQARSRFLESLSIGLEIGTAMYVEKSVVGLAEILYTEQSYDEAYRLVSAIEVQPSPDPDAVERAQRLVGELDSNLSAKSKQGIRAALGKDSLQTIADELLANEK